ncbi:MAG TPA: branched-chain alpha-keto acid dehydrogenase subunit E2 [Gammaproteobacteria bacterium]|nr:branched-chain alpha-keto acid dehydrogenase subunit E2 [Gammaproteobacteria bacterium]
MTDPQDILVPDIGDFDHVDVIEVLVAAGDKVDVESPLITLESDKATMDIPSPVAGTVTEVRIAVGDQVSQGSLVAKVETSDLVSEAETPNAAVLEEASPRKDLESESGHDLPVSEHPNSTPPVVPRPPPSLPPTIESDVEPLPHASPAVRRFARELGADLSKLNGTGAYGRILKEDVTAFIKSMLSQGQGTDDSQGGFDLPKIPEVDFSRWGPVETEPLSRIKRISGRHLQRAWLNVPHVTHHDEADVTELEAFRKTLKQESAYSEVRITLLGFVIKALTSAMKTFPTINASLSSDGETLILKRYFNVGVAVDTKNGLLVPVLRDVDTKGILELAGELDDLSARAREGKLKPDEMQGGCISISSLGGIGGIGFTPIVNAPEVAILGVSRAQIKPRWDGNAFEPCLMLPLDFSYDHRVIDGAEAARVTAFIVSALEDSRRLLL